jgi:hypothetical protein
MEALAVSLARCTCPASGSMSGAKRALTNTAGSKLLSAANRAALPRPRILGHSFDQRQRPAATAAGRPVHDTELKL